MTALTCTAPAEGRQHCAVNTSAGVLMKRALSESSCLLGKTWGYDDQGVWVKDGCSAEFVVTVPPGSAAPAGAVAVAAPVSTESAVATEQTPEAAPAHETWGVLDPGKGFLLGRNEFGEASLSGYALIRYINQMDSDEVFTDHLGRTKEVDGRNDIYSHRVLVWLNGWVADPKLRYTITWWTVTDTDQDALFGNLGYQFSDAFNLYGGVFGNPGSRSMQGSHPYWLGHDRVMADEFFRPFFTQGLYANGTVAPGVWYSASVGNTSSTLGTTSTQLDRKFTYGGSVWWMPTTEEFGPRGAYGDWEYHEEVSTRFGLSAVFSPEERYTDIGTASGNTSLKLADGLNVFETGALANGVTVQNVDYHIFSVDAGVKYKGMFLQAEYYQRRLENFRGDGALPVNKIDDNGFYVQAAFYPKPKVVEVYVATSQIYGDKSAGFDNSAEYILGSNYYPFETRNHRLNLQYQRVVESPVGSSFGYYVAGQNGNTIAASFSVFF
ncbi:MAG: DUF3011 domain-containing protein [Moraxellaceae bacterium]